MKWKITTNNYKIPKAKPPLTYYQTHHSQFWTFIKTRPYLTSLCEGSITEAECLSALKAFQRNKIPGTDGLTAEFYLCFWNEISCPLIDCLNQGAL